MKDRFNIYNIIEKYKSYLTLFFIFLLFIFPSSLYYFGLSSSFALGTSIICASLIFLNFIFFKKTKYKFSLFKINKWLFSLSIIFILFLHILTLIIFSNFLIDLPRFFYSLVTLFLIFISSFILAEMYVSIDNNQLNSSIHIIFWVMNILAIISLIGISIPGSNATVKPVFPFTEPSHFSLTYVILLLYLSTNSLKFTSKISYLLMGIFLTIALENLTLGVGCIIVLIVNFRIRDLVIITIIFLIGLSFYDLSYFTDRLDMSEENQNLSKLVYLQGWELIIESLKNSKIWGLGFQQLGMTPTEVNSADLIYKQLGYNLNVLDGGFVLSKLISELGFFSIILSILFFKYEIKIYRNLKLLSLRAIKLEPKILFAKCCILSSLVEILIRGMGYFTGTLFLCITGFIFLLNVENS